jgi:molecular chaperone GrpE
MGALIEGVRATERTLMHALERFRVRKIEALGAPFDPPLHEAVMEVDDGSYPPGSVARVLQDGYMIHDRLLRTARVAVANHRSNEIAFAGRGDATGAIAISSSY